MEYKITTLPNKLRLLSLPMPGVKSVTVLILVGTGSRYERRENNGISHFLEHMVYKGTKKRPGAIDIPTEIEGMGGAWNAFTSKDHTGFYIKAAVTHLEHIFEILSDVLQNSLMKEEEIEKEKGVIVEEINMYEDTPMQKVGEIYDELMFGDVPLGWHIAGSPAGVRSFNRKTFTDYWQSHYVPGNMVVAVAGGVAASSKLKTQSSKLEELAEKYLGKWTDGEAAGCELAKVAQDGPRVKIKTKKTEQAHMCIGVPAFSLDHPDRYNLSIMSVILGGGGSSRLFDEIREKRGLAYYCRSSNDQYTDVGHFVTQSGIILAKIEEAIKVICHEFQLLSTNTRKVEKKELDRAKELLKGHLILSLEDSRNVAGFFGTDLLIEKEIRTTEEIIKKIDAVTAEDVVRVASDLFRQDKLNLAIIGPYEDEEKFQQLLKL